MRTGDDIILPFEVKRLGVRGRIIRLGATVDDIIGRHEYPASVSALLAEAVALTAMLGSSLKFDGKLILQTSTDGPVDLLVADFNTPGEVRAYAHFDADRVKELEDAGKATPEALIGNGRLAMTIDQGGDMDRYQGIVPLEGVSLSSAANVYFHQSEQLPTDVRLAAGPIFSRGEGGVQHWRAGGIMIQHLPREGAASPLALSSGDMPGDGEEEEFEENDDWVRARLFLATVEDHELLDPTLAPEVLLYRLFHEDGVTAYTPSQVSRYCQCSRERVADIVTQFGSEAISDMVEQGKVSVTCEFCSTIYEFELPELVKTS